MSLLRPQIYPNITLCSVEYALEVCEIRVCLDMIAWRYKLRCVTTNGLKPSSLLSGTPKIIRHSLGRSNTMCRECSGNCTVLHCLFRWWWIGPGKVKLSCPWFGLDVAHYFVQYDTTKGIHVLVRPIISSWCSLIGVYHVPLSLVLTLGACMAEQKFLSGPTARLKLAQSSYPSSISLAPFNSILLMICGERSRVSRCRYDLSDYISS